MVDKIKKELESAFSILEFDEENHKYYAEGKSLPSVTTQIKQYEEKVNWDNIAHFSALAWNRKNPTDPKTASQIRWEWLEKGRKAAEAGTKVHLFAETMDRDPESPKEQGVLEFYEAIDHPIVCKELRMFSNNIAGTADLILLNKKTKNLIIADWKTNEDLHKNYKGKTLMPPFTDMLSSAFNKYCIQLAYYKKILEEKTPYKVESTWIIWLTDRKDITDKVSVIGKNYRLYSTPNLVKTINEFQSVNLSDFF
jgi:hypothetical protein